MKRNIFILAAILLCVIFCLPTTTYAQTYNLSGTDLSISVDDTSWYVFTRDNIVNNPELDELGVTYEYIYDFLYDNDAYMDAILFYENGEYIELFIRKKTLDTGVVNLSNYKDSEVLKLAKELAKKPGAEKYSVHKSQYKFAKLEYIDPTYGYYMYEFCTVVNKDNYTLTFQSTSEYTDEEYAEMDRIVNSVRFDVDTSLKEKKSESVAEKTIGGAIGGCIAGGIIALINKKKKSRKADNGSATNNVEF